MRRPVKLLAKPIRIGPAVKGAALALLLAATGVPGWVVTPALAAGEVPVLTATRVDSLPAINGDALDAAWQKAPAATVGSVTLKAVYTDEAIALLIMYGDPTLRMVTPGAWSYSDGQWRRLGDPDASAASPCQPHRVSLKWGDTGKAGEVWDLLAVPLTASGAGGAWGFVAGAQEAVQGRSIRLSRDPSGVPSVQAGKVTFTGWGHVRPASQDGPSAPLWRANSDPAGTAPLYIEPNPRNWADAMVITQSDVEAGRARAVRELSPVEVRRAWDRYAQLGAVVPALILQRPGEPKSGYLDVGATWENGTWTVEIRRDRKVQEAGGLQFAGTDAAYPLEVLLATSADERCSQQLVPLLLRFEAAQPGLSEEYSDTPGKSGCYCRTKI